MDGMGFYTDANGKRGDTNVHFNKPYLIRKWLPHYDWVLWLDMDTLVIDMAKPIETFIEEIGGQVKPAPRAPSVGEVLHKTVVVTLFACARATLSFFVPGPLRVVVSGVYFWR